ncbi:MAG TPA: imidazole glycerol phosphate synthase subunit HisH [Rhodocyclaceae bacterium]
MKPAKVVVVDYGMGNLLSVRRALEHVGAEVEQCADPDALGLAPKIILPGVGAFADGMAELRRLGLDVALREAAQRRTPIMGICLGMQMLFDSSEEFGHSAGLGLIPGRVVGIPRVGENGVPRKIPHIGWNDLVLAGGRQSWCGSLLEAVAEGSSVYFVHSFMAVPNDPADCLANCLYEGQAVTAAVAHENVSGCQFHPEKSGQVGLSVMRQFLAI